MNYLYQHANFEQIDLVISIFGQFLDRNKPVQEIFGSGSLNVQDDRIPTIRKETTRASFPGTS